MFLTLLKPQEDEPEAMLGIYDIYIEIQLVYQQAPLLDYHFRIITFDWSINKLKYMHCNKSLFYKVQACNVHQSIIKLLVITYKNLMLCLETVQEANCCLG